MAKEDTANNNEKDKIEQLTEEKTKLERNNRILNQLSTDRGNRINQLEIELATYKSMLQNQ